MTKLRFNFPGQRHVLDIVYLVVLTGVLPFFIFIYIDSKERHNISLYDVAKWTFLVGLVLFHALCFLRKNTASPQLPRLIDYIYVSSAVIGLSGAAVDADRTVRVQTYSESVRLSKLNLDWMKDQVDRAAEAACTSDNKSGQCSDLTSAREFIDEGLPRVISSDNLASFEEFTRKVDTRIATLAALPQAERDHIIHYDTTVRTLSSITAVPPEPDYSWKFLGVLFLPSALALRITKISVEIFGWFPKA